MNKKVLIKIFLTVILLNALSTCAFALDDAALKEQIDASGANEVLEVLGEDELELLEQLGITEVDFNAVFSMSPRQIFDLFFQVVRNEYRTPFKSFTVLAAMVILLAAVNQFLPDGISTNKAFDLLCAVLASLVIFVPASACITRALSAIYMTCNFVAALVPVLAAVITVSGNPTLALTYNSLSFTVAQVVAQVGNSVIRPMVQVVFSLSVISSVSDALNIKSIVEFAKKTAVFVMSFAATVFVTMLTLKGMLATSADTVAVRGIRFLIGNAVPVVGSAVSDAYLSIIGTLSLVKNTVGAVAVLAVVVINLPVLIECVIWVFMLNILATLADLFSQSRLSQLFRCVSSSSVLLSVTLVFEMLVFVLSVGLILVVKGGGQ